MSARVQQKNEDVNTYFHDKARLCRALKLTFTETKEQVIEGLWSKELSLHLLATTHVDEDSLLTDIRNFERINENRVNRIRQTRTPNHIESTTKPKSQISYNYPQPATVRVKSENVTPQPAERRSNEVQCYNCKKAGHIARDCPAPCNNCKRLGHLTRDCPESRRPIVCRNCNRPGHISRFCTQLRSSETDKENMPANTKIGSIQQLTVRKGTHSIGKYLKMIRINNHAIEAMIDTGSSSCTIQLDIAKLLELEFEDYATNLYGFGNANEAVAETLGKIAVTLEIDGTPGHVELLVVPNGTQPVPIIVGRNWLDLPDVAMLKKDDSLIIGNRDSFPFSHLEIVQEDKPRTVKLVAAEETLLQAKHVNWVEVEAKNTANANISLMNDNYKIIDSKIRVPIMNTEDIDFTVRKGTQVTSARIKGIEERPAIHSCEKGCDVIPDPITLDILDMDTTVDVRDGKELVKLLNEFRNCFATSMEELGCTSLVRMDIQEVPGSMPVHSKPYRTTMEERKIISEIIKDWRKHGIVTDTTSEYASPVLLVKKKSGEHRLVIDFRKLNTQTKRENYPIPNFDDVLDQLTGCTIFAVLDLAHGFLQIPLTEEAKEKTAFITQDETGKFERMIFGLKNAPVQFQKLMNRVLGPLRNTVAVCYLDDILIPAKDWRDLLQRLRLVLERIQEAGLTLKLKKCLFGKRELEYLGFRITQNTIKPGLGKMESIEQYPTPKSSTEILRFLGLTSFFRRFIPRFAEKSEPLTKLTRKNAVFSWGPLQQKAFELLKDALVTSPTLMIYDSRAYTELHTDASSSGLAGMLFQKGHDTRMHLVYAVSKRTTDAERNYHSSKLELLAIVWTLERLRHLLIGIQFTIITDCQALVYLNANRTSNPQICRWYNMIQEYNMEVKHRPNDKMKHVDALSRASVEPASDITEEIVSNNLEVYLNVTIDDQVLMMQKGDPELKKLVEILEKPKENLTSKEKESTKNYAIVNQRLMYQPVRGEYLFVVPKAMRKAIVVKCHDLMGHFGQERTMSKILENYWFPRMKRYVKCHIHMCFECMLNKPQAGRVKGFLNPIQPGNRPFQIVHIDHIGPFVTSLKRNKYLLLLVDNLTKFVLLYPCKRTTTKEVKKALDTFITNYGEPDTLISDRATCFTAEEFGSYCTSHGIRHILNSTKRPQANGQVERANRTLIPVIISKINRVDYRDWDEHVPEIQRDLNNSVNKTTNKTPFELLHGFRPTFHDGVSRLLTNREKQYTNPNQLQTEAKVRIVEQQKHYKRQYDKKRCSPPIYDTGEIVFMKRVPTHTGESTKLQPKYRGPLVITEVLPADVYRVTDLAANDGRMFATTAHVSQLKQWKCQNVEDEETSSEENSENEESEPEGEDSSGKSETEEGQGEPADEADVQSEVNTSTRPRRQQRKPSRFRDYVMGEDA